jgi:NAD(P)-dependent dehydrogenase (short-subunit alcohol dehydrogenase family)
MQIEAGRVAVVTGGASGIGYALAAAAAGRGLSVVLSDVADVPRVDDIDRLAQTALALGSVQLICSNAGIVLAGRAWELTAADWERVMNVNFMATVHLIRAFLPRLIEEGRPARLLVTGSMASVTARPGIGPYVAAKHALLGLCESLNGELAEAGADVRATLLLPGKVATGMSREDYPDAITPDEAARIAFDAIERDRPLAFTHADRIPEVERRFAAIVADGRPG